MDRSLVLIIDNDQEVTASLSGALEKQGYEVVSVNTAEHGLDAIRQRPPGLIIGSISLPAENFLALCRTIRNDLSLPEIPVLVLLPPEARYEAGYGESYGIVDALTRPVDTVEAVKLVKEHCPPKAAPATDTDEDWMKQVDEALTPKTPEKPVDVSKADKFSKAYTLPDKYALSEEPSGTVKSSHEEVTHAEEVPKAADISREDKVSAEASKADEILKADNLSREDKIKEKEPPAEMGLPFDGGPGDRADDKADEEEDDTFRKESKESEDIQSFFSSLKSDDDGDPAERMERELRESVDIERRRRLIVIGAVCLVLGIAAGFFMFSFGDKEPPPPVRVTDTTEMPEVETPAEKAPEPEGGEGEGTGAVSIKDPFEDIIKADVEREQSASATASRQPPVPAPEEIPAAEAPPSPKITPKPVPKPAPKTAAAPKSSPSAHTGSLYAVQVGAFMVEANAKELVDRLELKGFSVSVINERFRDGRVLHKVVVGRFDNRDDAKEQLRLLASAEGIEGMVTVLPKGELN